MTNMSRTREETVDLWFREPAEEAEWRTEGETSDLEEESTTLPRAEEATEEDLTMGISSSSRIMTTRIEKRDT